MTERLGRIQNKYRMSLGRELCEKYNLKKGDYIILRDVGGAIMIIASKVVPKDDSQTL